MGIRVNAIPSTGFRHAGLVIGKAWVELEKLDEKQRAALRDFHGKHIRINPNDIDKLAEFGLAFKDAKSPLVEITTKKKSGGNAAGKE